MAIFGTISGLTLGLAGPGADLIAGEAAGKGAQYTAAQRAFPDRFYLLGMIVEFLKQLQSFHIIALDATGAIFEDKHDGHSKKNADQRMTVQYQDSQKQFIQEKAAQGIYIQPKPLGYQPGQQYQLQQPVTQTYQPLPPSQDQKHEYVTVSESQNCTVPYQPASQQQNFAPDGRWTSAAIKCMPAITSIFFYTRLTPASRCSRCTHTRSITKTVFISARDTSIPSPMLYSIANLLSVARSFSPTISKQLALEPSVVVCKSSIVDFPIDVFELPAELVTAAVPDEDSIPATPSMEDELLILKARILQMEIERGGGAVDIVPAKNELEVSHQDSASLQSALTVDVEEPAEHQDTQNKQNEQKLAAELVTKEQTRKSPSSVSFIVDEHFEYQTTQVKIISRQRPPPLPFRPKSQIFHSPPVLQQQQQQYSAPIASYIEAPQPLPKPSYQNPYVPQPSGASAGYNPQTYSPASPPTQQETQVPTPRPQSAYQPLSFPIYLNGAPIQQQ
ncbi:uncharacterized protein RCO7_02036 [Rhynchosporium graminicola]|uniref:Uncharacterized protein n=1 Tax=Rhynchosporium graminicola TaxID=2792576 RepID=A0A1E1KTI7_9HELO|nr:uncharacterized protein RCO7_02036 [Rhynchosporium commune]